MRIIGQTHTRVRMTIAREQREDVQTGNPGPRSFPQGGSLVGRVKESRALTLY